MQVPVLKEIWLVYKFEHNMGEFFVLDLRKIVAT